MTARQLLLGIAGQAGEVATVAAAQVGLRLAAGAFIVAGAPVILGLAVLTWLDDRRVP